MVSSPRCKRWCIYMRIYARVRSITINLPNAYENNAGLRGPLDLDLVMRTVHRRCFHRPLESHFGGWLGRMADYRTALNCTVRFGNERAFLHSRPPRSRSGDFRADKVWVSANPPRSSIVLDNCFFLLTVTCFTRPLMKIPFAVFGQLCSP
jgi:hypothetical protein